MQIITKSETLPIALAEVKAHLQVEHELDNTLITSIIWAAIEFCEGYTGCDFRAITYDVWRSGWTHRINLPRSPVTAVTSVKYRDTDNAEQTVDSENYFVMTPSRLPGFIFFDSSWSKPTLYKRPDAVTVRFSTGFADLPWQVDAAIKLIAYHLYENRSQEAEKMTYQTKLGVYKLLDQIAITPGG